MPTLKDIADRLDKLFQQNAEPWPRWLSVQRAAEYASLSDVSIRRLLSTGKLTAHRPCRGKVLIDKLQLDSMIAGATAQPRTGRGFHN